MNLQPTASTCFVSGQAFAEGERVASFLVRGPALEIMRYDVGEPAAVDFRPEGTVACRWVHGFKPRAKEENADRAMKLTAENLFLTLSDPATEPTPETVRLVQFLALMLERKRLLRPKGLTADGTRRVYEHARSKERHEVPVGELDQAFFIAIQEQLSVLVGPPRETPAPAPTPATVAAE